MGQGGPLPARDSDEAQGWDSPPPSLPRWSGVFPPQGLPAKADSPDRKPLRTGVEGELGTSLGIDDDFMVKVLKQVGNYEEVYDRNLGPGTIFNLERGLNALWTEGGLLYAPPFR